MSQLCLYDLLRMANSFKQCPKSDNSSFFLLPERPKKTSLAVWTMGHFERAVRLDHGGCTSSRKAGKLARDAFISRETPDGLDPQLARG